MNFVTAARTNWNLYKVYRPFEKMLTFIVNVC